MGHASPKLQRKTNSQNGGEKRTWSFKQQIHPNVPAPTLRGKHSRRNIRTGITGVAGRRVASSRRLFGSYYEYIVIEVVDTTSRSAPPRSSFCGRNVTKVNIGKFVKTLGTSEAAIEAIAGGDDTNNAVNSVMDLITTACGASIPRRHRNVANIIALVDGGNCRASERVSQTPPHDQTTRRRHVP